MFFQVMRPMWRYLVMHSFQVRQDSQQVEFLCLVSQKISLKVLLSIVSYTQLVGGMSFIYLVITAFYPESKLQSMRGFISGRTLHMKELFLTITVIFVVYIVIVAMLLYFVGETTPIDEFSLERLIDNFSLAMSTIATGGFIPTSTILENLVWQEHLILMAAMILGALPFTFHYAFVRKKFLAPKLGKEVLTYFAILGSATAYSW